MTKKILKWTFLTLFLVASLLIAVEGSVSAQGGDEYPENVDPDKVYDISHEMYCDVCQGVPLSDCPSTQCQVWREEIAGYLSQGMTEQEIFTRMGQRYGDKISGIPLDEGDRTFTYIVPIALALLSALAIGVYMYRWNNKEDSTALKVAVAAGTLQDDTNRPVPDNVDPDYLERFLQLLREDKA